MGDNMRLFKILILILFSQIQLFADASISANFHSISYDDSNSFKLDSISIPSYLSNDDFSGLSLSSHASKINPASIEKKIIGGVYNYPNPVRQNDTTRIGYELSKNMDIDIIVFDSRGNQIFETHFSSGSQGGIGGAGTYNRVDLRAAGLPISQLSVGIYFYIIKSGSEALGKGKIAVIP